ncbi:MAG TPA: 4Fe-4S dicluster domain-containing protein [Myxococcota bacterium]|nr:4Fe-4S dicluster domain-containing protein [Myxococcota bacterium]
MARVYNWQIGREMEYPYEGARPRRQFAAIFDTNKCIACQSCTLACKGAWTSSRGQEYMFWNNVETKPYGYFPLGWDVRILEQLGVREADGPVYQGKTLFESAPAGERVLGYLPDEADWAHVNVGEDDSAGAAIERGAYFQMPHVQWMFYLARICNHCTYPACLASCPRQSIYKRPEDGVVLIDQTRCRGYRECVKGCPYKKTYYNPVTRVSEKCIGCYPRIEVGLQSTCMNACIGKIRLQGFISTPDQVREDNPIDFLVHVRKLAKPLYPQFGLEPNVYYVPPIHVPPAFLRQMFGYGVEDAVAAYRKLPDDKDLLAALAVFGNSPFIVHRFRREGDLALGFDEKGTEIVRVPFYEPTILRAFEDGAHGAFRHNTT